MSRSIAISLLTLSALGTGLLNTAPAHAVSLIPAQEGEVQTTNLGCLAGNPCITPSAFTVKSLAYSPQMGLSRLFVDTRGTKNLYNGGISFWTEDAGTNGALNEYWLRPVAYEANGSVSVAEGGQLEVGRFEFTFAQAWDKLTLKLLDVEDSLKSGILSYTDGSGASFNINQLLSRGPNNSVQTITLTDVKSLVVQLGQPGTNYGYNSRFSTGDGVNLSFTTPVPEPGTLVGLGMIAGAGVLGLRQRKQKAS